MKKSILVLLLLTSFYFGYCQTCTLSVAISASSPGICQGTSVILTATPSAGKQPYTYIWSTGETTSTISVNKAGTYSVTVSDQTSGCPPVVKSITISNSSAEAPVAAGVSLCQSGPATLTATGPGGNYQWYDSPTGGNFLKSGSTYTIPDVKTTTTYYVQTIINGCTSARTSVTVRLAGKPTVIDTIVCAGTPATLIASGADSYVWYNAPSGGAVLSTSATYTTGALTQNTTFYLVATTGSCSTGRIPEIAKVAPPPQIPTTTTPNVTICSGMTTSLHASVPQGVINWYSVPNGGVPLISSADFTTPSLTSTTVYYAENSLNGCVSARTPVTVTVNQAPTAPANQVDTICYNSSTTLSVSTASSGTYQWYDAPTGGNLLNTGNTYTTPVLQSSVTYYVQINNGGCVSSRAAISVILKSPVALPSVSAPLICPGSSVTLTATAPGGIYQWYDAPTGGNLLATGATFTTPALLTQTTYYVQTTLSGCTSARAAVPVTILPASAGPTAKGTSLCSGGVATLTATGATGDYSWYDAATGGNYLSSGQVFVTPALTSTTTYYVESTTSTGCTTLRTPVTVTVNPIPASPTVNSVSTICPGSSVTLIANSAGGINQWYDAATGGNQLATGNTYTTPTLTTSTTYYVENVNNGCVSTRTPVPVTVTTVTYSSFDYHSNTICNSSLNLTPTITNQQGGTFSSSPSGLSLNNSTGEINVSASTQGTYLVSLSVGGICPQIITRSVTITSSPNPGIAYKSTYCLNDANPKPTSPYQAGSFTSTPAGLVFVNAQTGEIDLSKSKPGFYTITNTITAGGTCGIVAGTANVTLVAPIAVSAGSNQSVAPGGSVQLKGTVSSGTGTWSAPSGTFSNTTDPNATYTPSITAGSVKLTFTSNDPGAPCGPQSKSVTITVSSTPSGPNPPAAPTALSQSVCLGSGTTLSATAPGGRYEWYDAATGGTLLFTGPNFTTPALTATTVYYVQTTVGSLTSNRTPVTVTVIPTLNVPTVSSVAPICQGEGATLKATVPPGVTVEWYDALTGGNLLFIGSPVITPHLSVNTTYYAEASLGNCTSPRVPVIITVGTVPHITSASAGSTCSGAALPYLITSDVSAATFKWTRAAVAGISNAAANGATSTINETLVNTGITAVNVTYSIAATDGSCSSIPFNYVVTVYPSPIVTSLPTATFCSGSPGNYTFKVNSPLTSFTWSRAAVAGIRNTPVTGQSDAIIQEVLFDTTSAPVKVTYTFNYGINTCQAAPFNLVVTVNPTAVITSAPKGFACNGLAQDYSITSNVTGTTFTWSRAAVTGISNPAVSNVNSNTITEALINTTGAPLEVNYIITPMANGCPGTPFIYTVIVSAIPATPTASSNSPVCLNSTLQLNTPTVYSATYSWTGPNGFTSSSQNPSITNVSADYTGTYHVSVSVNGCSSAAASTDVVVDQPPVSNAGPPQTVCIGVTSVQLAGSISGGTTTGIWSTNGSGSFSPAANKLDAKYIPTAADKAVGSVTLTLSSTSRDNCSIATNSMTITFGKVPAVNAGPDQEVCSQLSSIPLSGKQFAPGGVVWSTLGSGTFSPSANVLNANYIPGADDIKKGSAILVLSDPSADSCFIAVDTMIIKLAPPPVVNLSPIRYVLKGNTIIMEPSVNEKKGVHYFWTPDIEINNDTLKNPTITGDVNTKYTLTVTDSLGCETQKDVMVIVSPELKVANTFTPNGDLKNDYWDIPGLVAYQNASVDVFDRYGQKVFHSIGYPTPWDGSYYNNGKMLPVGTYYYIVDTKVNNLILTGYVTIIR